MAAPDWPQESAIRRGGISVFRRPESPPQDIADQFRDRWRKRAAFMDASKHNIFAYMDFPARRRTKFHRTRLLERFRLNLP